ncbi:hypothetical protein A4X03_0g6670 [Tilletia caries]|uniref:Growth hormone-inducible transmembrane protein n=1 Tax=Tilletia caries TaxID=13290 RepID=A0A177U1W9_9BASI|nr:hypothetical protein A4X03_0g6670 [Tilletia caries]
MFALRPVITGNGNGVATSAMRATSMLRSGVTSSMGSSSGSSGALRILHSARFSSRPAPSPASSTRFFTSHSPTSQARPMASALVSLRSVGLRATGGSTFALAGRRMIGTQPQSAPTLVRGATLAETFSRPENRRSLLMNIGLVAGTALAASLFFNRETREAPLDAFSKDYLNSAFRYLAGGLTMTGITALSLHRSGFSYRLMAMNPWVVMIGGLAVSIGGMIGAQSFEPGSPAKYLSWFVFNAAQGAVLAPIFFFNPALLARAGLYTAGVVGSLCYVGATARDGQFLYLGGPLLAGVTVVALSGLSPLVLPATAIRTLAAAEAISLYGGLAVFSGFLLYDTQKILNHAKMAQRGLIRPDPLRESIGLELDVINIFIRLVQILAMQGNGNRRK